MTLRIRCLLFDLDGVLIDSEPLHARQWVEILREAGVELEPQRLRRFIGLRGEDLMEALRRSDPAVAARLDVQALLEEKRRRFWESLGELQPIAGAEAFLRAQRGRRRLALVTSMRLRSVGRVLAQLQWRNVFDVLVAADHVERLKPDPEPYRQALARLRVAPEHAVAFEDSLPGIAAARAAGLLVCAPATSHAPDELRQAGARWVVRDFTDGAAIERAIEAGD